MPVSAVRYRNRARNNMGADEYWTTEINADPTMVASNAPTATPPYTFISATTVWDGPLSGTNISDPVVVGPLPDTYDWT